MSHKQTVLIADDDADFVLALSKQCEALGLETFRSPDAMHALLGAHRIAPDLVIMDVNMPGGNGLSACEMIAGDGQLSKIPVIVVTGDSDEDVIRRCRAAGADYVRKGADLWQRLAPLILHKLGLDSGPLLRSPPPADSTASSEPAHSLGPRILCIDDDPEISKLIKLRLEPLGCDVIRAFNSTQGFWSALDLRPDVILCDLNMPDGEGNYLYGRLRLHPLTQNIPVIIVSGITNPAICRTMLSLGVSAYLTKPIDFRELIKAIEYHVLIPGCNPQAGQRPADPVGREPSVPAATLN